MLYPNNIKKKVSNQVSHSNRGMKLEMLINESNKYYDEIGTALITKKPTPIGVVDVEFKNQKKYIKKAYFQEQSTLDYNGIYRGKYIDFDAKETINKTSFPLSNIHEHQTMHLRKVIKHGGISFFLIKMNQITYLLSGQDYLSYIDNETRKSIPIEYIKEHGVIVKESYRPALDYLKAVDVIYFKGE